MILTFFISAMLIGGVADSKEETDKIRFTEMISEEETSVPKPIITNKL